MEDVKKTLSQEDLKQFELNTKDEEIRRLEHDKQEMKLQLIQLRRQILLGKVDLLNAQEQLELHAKKEMIERHDSKRLLHKEFVEELKKELDIDSQKWGFNPETGEILED